MSTHSSSLRLLKGFYSSQTVPYPTPGMVVPDPLADSSATVTPDGLTIELPRSVDSATKRVMDIVGALGGLLVLAPVMAIVALLIRLESRGPILFRQPRLGLRGRVFLCCKFRTMVPDAEKRLRDLEARNESGGGVLFKIKDDPRVTPLGRFLRKNSLDELPQLWNVLMGEMSLVGPRPLQIRDCERLAELDPDGYEQRLSVVPGLTGPWQIGGRSELDYSRMIDLDREYVASWTLSTDIAIIIKTVGVVLEGKGAC
ncbi:sugar transferase [Tundrisphaera lichenicola]|uniref:sugar transferase n=1 Tax=Tundrisphaera lichenicola TaxID=2029860 RepID=UPI003EB99230